MRADSSAPRHEMDPDYERTLVPLLKQHLRRVLAEQPDSRKGRTSPWAPLLFPLYVLRWVADTLFNRGRLESVELGLDEADLQYATLFPQPVRSSCCATANVGWVHLVSEWESEHVGAEYVNMLLRSCI